MKQSEAQNISTEEMQEALLRLAEQMGKSVKEYLDSKLTGGKADVTNANEKFRTAVGLNNSIS